MIALSPAASHEVSPRTQSPAPPASARGLLAPVLALVLALGGLAAALLVSLQFLPGRASSAAHPAAGGFTPIADPAAAFLCLGPQLSSDGAAAGEDTGEADVSGSAGEAASLAGPERGGEDTEEAIPALEAAVSVAPSSASALSDLAALYFEQAAARRQPVALLRALDLAERAVESDPASSVSWYNRALILAHLGLWTEARASLRESLRLGGDTDRERSVASLLEALDREGLPGGEKGSIEQAEEIVRAVREGRDQDVRDLVAASRGKARAYLEMKLLPSWGKVLLAGGDPVAVKVAGDAAGRDTDRTMGEAIGQAAGKFAGEAAGRDTGQVTEKAIDPAAGRVTGGPAGRTTGEAAGKTSVKFPGEALAVAGAIASALQDLEGDSLYAESVAAIRAAAGDPARLAQIASGYRAFGEGMAQVKHDAGEARRSFIAASAAFARAGHPFALRAEYEQSACDPYLDHYQAALRQAPRVAESAQARGYRNLAFESFWVAGLAATRKREPDVADSFYRRALAIARETGDAVNIAGMSNLVAERLLVVGDREGAWDQIQTLLGQVRAISDPGRLHQIYVNAANAAMRLGYPVPALRFLDEALRQARTLNNPALLADTYRLRAGSDLRARRHEDGLRDAEHAERHLAGVPPGKERDLLAMDLRFVEGELALGEHPRAAVAKLRYAVAAFDRSEYRATLASLHASLGRALAATDDLDEAAGWLRTSADELEKLRADLSAPKERISWRHESEEAFDSLADVELRLDNAEAAFLAEERRRGRAVLDRLEGSAAPLLAADALRAELPTDRAVVEYATLGRPTGTTGSAAPMGAWVLRAGGLRWVQLALDAEEASRAADRLVKAIRHGATLEDLRRDRDASALYQGLVAPVVKDLPAGDALVLVADGPLAELPFAALFDRRTNSFLVEQRPLAFAASANVYVRLLRRDRSLPHPRSPEALVVGDPLPGPGERDLPPLPWARQEARRIAALYPGSGSALLLGEQAVKSAFLAEAGAHEVVHFAGHAVANLDSPERSRLLFSPEAADPEGALVAREIRDADFAATRLVVLGACSTAGGAAESDGLDGLVQPFLAAGVPAVVASLWKVEDDLAAPLLVGFHRRLASGGDALHALQAAQVALLHSPRDLDRLPAGWAAFRLIGEAASPRAASAVGRD